MTISVLAMPLMAVAQSTDNVKQDQPQQQDQMKHDGMSQDQSKKDDMSKDDMKGKKAKKAKKNKIKNDNMKKDDNMKHDDMKNDDSTKPYWCRCAPHIYWTAVPDPQMCTVAQILLRAGGFSPAQFLPEFVVAGRKITHQA